MFMSYIYNTIRLSNLKLNTFNSLFFSGFFKTWLQNQNITPLPTLYREENMAKKLKTICVLGEDELDVIINKVNDPADWKSFSEVCKLWFKVESLNRSSLHLVGSDFSRQVLSRFPNLVRFETGHSITDDDLELLGQTCPKLEVVNLTAVNSLWDKASDLLGVGLLGLAKGCLKLSKVMLHKRWSIINSVPSSLISLAPNLKHLDLGWCSYVSDDALEAIGSSSSITYLNLGGCSRLITDKGLGFLGNGSISKILKTFILDFLYNITDVGVSHLRKMHCLEQLSLAGCSPFITDTGGAAISAIPTLKKLNLGALSRVSDRTVVALAQNCPNLEILDLSFCGQITEAGIRAFSGHTGLQTIGLLYCKVGASDLEHLVLRCGSLKSIILHHKQVERILPLMQEQAKRFVKRGRLENFVVVLE